MLTNMSNSGFKALEKRGGGEVITKAFFLYFNLTWPPSSWELIKAGG